MIECYERLKNSKTSMNSSFRQLNDLRPMLVDSVNNEM